MTLHRRKNHKSEVQDSNKNDLAFLRKEIIHLNKRCYESNDVSVESMYTTALNLSKYNHKLKNKPSSTLHHLICLCVLLINFTYMFWLTHNPADKCLIQTPNVIKHLVRPLDSCGYCRGLDLPKIFGNLTKNEFRKHAYKSYPMVLKNAVGHWPAKDILGVRFFKELYQKYEDALTYNYYEGCNYFPYDSGISTLEFFLAKTDTIDSNKIAKTSWYVGW